MSNILTLKCQIILHNNLSTIIKPLLIAQIGVLLELALVLNIDCHLNKFVMT